MIRSAAKSLLRQLPLPLAMLEEPYRFFRADTRAIRALKDRFAGKRSSSWATDRHSTRPTCRSWRTSTPSRCDNGIFFKTDEIGYRPTFYVVEDQHVLEDNLERITGDEAPFKFFPSHYRPLLGRGQNTYFFNANRGFYEPKSPTSGSLGSRRTARTGCSSGNRSPS